MGLAATPPTPAAAATFDMAKNQALVVIKAPMAAKMAAFLPHYIADIDVTPPP